MLLQKEVLVAVIASVSAFLLAFVQFLLQLRSSRRIEELKAALARQGLAHSEYMKAFLTFSAQGKQNELDAFRDLLNNVQNVRDTVRLLIDHPKSFPDVERLCAQLEDLRSQVLKAFSTQQMHLGGADRDAAHTLKNACSDLLTAIIEAARAGHRDSFIKSIGGTDSPVTVIASGQADFRARAARAAGLFAERLRVESGNGPDKPQN